MQITRRRAFPAGSLIAIACALVIASCLDVAEPTPVASFLRINPVNAFTDGAELASLSSFRMEFSVHNVGTRPVYLDLVNYRIEKLIDQRWQLAYEQTGPQFLAVQAIGASRLSTVPANAMYTRGGQPQWPLIEHIRGLYRVRFRLAFAPNGTDAVADSDSYSQPFVVR